MILTGDCLALMPTLEAASVDAIVTDPPYGLGFMGVKWDTYGDGKGRKPAGKPTFDQVGGNSHARKPGGIELIRMKENRRFQQKATQWAEAMLRVAKPGAHLVAFGGTRTFHRLTCAIEDAGWEIRDCLSWLYGSGFPKSHNLDGAWEGWGTALKPAWEPILLARKPLAGTVAANVAAHGTGALNVEGCRVEAAPGDYDHPGNDLPHTRRGREDWRMPDQQVKPNPLGRWPANVVLDPGAAALLDEQSGEAGGGFGVRGRGGKTYANGDGFANSLSVVGQVVGHGDTGGASRFFYCAKASRAEREEGLEGMGRKAKLWSSGEQSPGTFQAEGTDRTSTNHHPTVKPVSLMRWLCRLITPPGGLILDPFTGSGSTGVAAALEDFRFLGIEREPEYVAIAEARIAKASEQPSLWSVA